MNADVDTRQINADARPINHRRPDWCASPRRSAALAAVPETVSATTAVRAIAVRRLFDLVRERGLMGISSG
jgi:hypothetical protein